ncbi:hypothetical protein T07_480, partial [Trichinella nelsoni]
MLHKADLVFYFLPFLLVFIRLNNITKLTDIVSAINNKQLSNGANGPQDRCNCLRYIYIYVGETEAAETLIDRFIYCRPVIVEKLWKANSTTDLKTTIIFSSRILERLQMVTAVRSYTTQSAKMYTLLRIENSITQPK